MGARDATEGDRLDRFLGLSAQALRLRARRLEVIASNIANAATPGYRARDLDFRAALAEREDGPPLARTDPRHLAARQTDERPQLRFRRPVQPSLDGNTVELAVEQVAFAETAVRYRATLAFLDARVATLKAALRGET
ncbi:MAG: flagellar basal body rod protein FlgB [Sphingomonadaceae bacterium]|uniref:flagellar basal body rod protein FlgB n=1 Tax=Thermaurantiacus sp. TaxID=2820283 RepID=UPI00298F1E94|nr:flagellar basal body rod protein FlgB [Thermaurantiacus sp.]MCS6985890.1 flagellar basal body rod protein FlgB [Sphingomonadaceae bacterium]MDW8414894.1 flagellar basal body rod protein FlgB [Thermaurantiacus sp.]